MEKQIEKKERTIRINDLIAYILKKWKLILVVMLVFAALGMIYKGKAEVAETTVRTEKKKKKPEDRADRELKSYLENSIESIGDSLEAWPELSDNYMIMNMDASSVVTNKLYYYVEMSDMTEETKVHDPADSVLSMYEFYIKEGLPIYLTEQTDLTKYPDAWKDIIFFEKSLEGNTFAVTVKYDNKTVCNKITDLASEYIETVGDKIRQTVGDCTVQKVDTMTSTNADIGLQRKQIDNCDNMIHIRNKIVSGQDEIEKIKKTSQGTELTANREISKKAIVKFGILGAVGGAVLVAGILFLMFIFDKKIRKAEQLKDNFGVKILGDVTAPDNTKGAVNRLIARFENAEKRSENEKERFQIVRENISLTLEQKHMEKTRLLVLGLMEEGRLSGILHEISGSQAEYESLVYEEASATVLKKLGTADGVILVVEKNKNTYENVWEQIRMVQESGKQLLGVIVA